MNLEKNLKKLVEIEGMNDMSIFFRSYETFEEIPIFSRFENIKFLSDMSFNKKNKILINHAVTLLKAIRNEGKIRLKEEKEEYFSCVSLIDWEEDEYKEINCITPCIYVSRRKSWLMSRLNLVQGNSIEENLILEYLCSLGEKEFDVRRSNNNKDFTRIYVI